MKIFLDTADFGSVIERARTGIIAGVTTNPTLVRKQGVDYRDLIAQLCDESFGFESVSAEVNGQTAEELLEDAENYIGLGEAVTIKLPLHMEGLIACRELASRGIKTNVTLCFSVAQAAVTALSGATYISPFVGRLNDNSVSGVELIRAISGLYCTQGQRTKILAASLRDVHHVSRCLLYGASVVTLPVGVFDKMYKHVLTDVGLDIFEQDFREINERN